jgi:hypothetical protein
MPDPVRWQVLNWNGATFVHFYKAAQHASALCEGKHRALMGTCDQHLLAQMLPMADWHKVCKTLFRPTVTQSSGQPPRSTTIDWPNRSWATSVDPA